MLELGDKMDKDKLQLYRLETNDRFPATYIKCQFFPPNSLHDFLERSRNGFDVKDSTDAESSHRLLLLMKPI